VSPKTLTQESFVVFPLGERRLALPTSDVVELSRTGSVHLFPHTMPALLGVLLRRGEILPVWDLAQTLLGSEEPTLKYCLVTRHNFAGEEWTAIPVSGECQMVRSDMLPPPEGSATYVRGVLLLDGQPIEVLDLVELGTPREPTETKERELAGEGEERV
jgi:purine-binding chemotaxis protein CheW